MKILKTFIALLLLAAIAVNISSCATPVQAADLMTGISSNNVSGKPSDEKFTASVADFSIELFKTNITDKENSLVSPLSVMLALAMTANGADNETLTQMETLLGGGIRSRWLQYMQTLRNSRFFRQAQRCSNRIAYLSLPGEIYRISA